jgi:AraC-like DNA-binding protein
MGPAISAMKKHYHDTLSVKALADIVHMSVSCFERKSKKYFSMTPKQYMRHYCVCR